MGATLSWAQFGLAGLIAVSLASVIAYIFKLLIESKNAEIERAYKERDNTNTENERLHNRIDDQQRTMLVTLADVARVMGDVQLMLREREVERRVADALKQKEDHGG